MLVAILKTFVPVMSAGIRSGRALHALKAETADPRQRFHGQRFCQSGNAFDHRMAAANQHEEQLIGNFALANQDLGQL